jgi:hypothetical protein
MERKKIKCQAFFTRVHNSFANSFIGGTPIAPSEAHGAIGAWLFVPSPPMRASQTRKAIGGLSTTIPCRMQTITSVSYTLLLFLFPGLKKSGGFGFISLKTLITVLTVQCTSFMALQAQDVSSQDPDKLLIDRTVKNLYRHLSYSNSNLENLDSIIPLFVKDAKLTACFGDQPKSWSVTEFIMFIKDAVTSQRITGRAETELFEETEIFGKISHRFSTYQIIFTMKDKAEQRRGINAIQLIKSDGRWIINSLVWDTEKKNLKIPHSHLGMEEKER